MNLKSDSSLINWAFYKGISPYLPAVLTSLLRFMAYHLSRSTNWLRIRLGFIKHGLYSLQHLCCWSLLWWWVLSLIPCSYPSLLCLFPLVRSALPPTYGAHPQLLFAHPCWVQRLLWQAQDLADFPLTQYIFL